MFRHFNALKQNKITYLIDNGIRIKCCIINIKRSIMITLQSNELYQLEKKLVIPLWWEKREIRLKIRLKI